MGVSILDNWQYLGKKPDFTRQLFETVADMVAFNENYLAPVYECNVIEDGCRYRYQLTNDLDPNLGRWRKVEGGGSGSSDIQNFYYDSVNKCVKIVTSSGSFSANIPEELNDADLINKITLDETNGILLYDGNPISGFTQAQMNLLNKLGENTSGELMFDGKEVNVMTPVEKENLDKIVNNIIVNEDQATGDVTVELGELILEAKKDVTGNVEGLLVNGMDVLIQETSAPDTSLDEEYGNLNWD